MDATRQPTDERGRGEEPDMKAFVGQLPDWEVERAIRHTMDLYAHAMDYGEEEIWRDCFTDDALFQKFPPGFEGRWYPRLGQPSQYLSSKQNP